MPRKFKIAFLSEQPFMVQISSKYFLLSFSSNGYLVRFLLATFNWSARYSSHPVFFWLNSFWFFYKFAGLWACNQLAPKYVRESESAFQIVLSEANEPKENETERLNFPKEEAA